MGWVSAKMQNKDILSIFDSNPSKSYCMATSKRGSEKKKIQTPLVSFADWTHKNVEFGIVGVAENRKPSIKYTREVAKKNNTDLAT